MKKHSKRYIECEKKKQESRDFTVAEALTQLAEMPKAKFDESISLNFQLGVRPDQPNEIVRGTVALPHGSGQKVRILCFAKGEAQKAAEEAGADFIGSDELVKKIESGWLDFDAVVAHPEMMREISRLGKVLGPRGLMPTPKTGTVTPDVGKAIAEIRAGRIEFKSDKTAGLHVLIGKRSFVVEHLRANAKAAIKVIMDSKPATSKGDYVKRVYLSASQTPGFRLRSSSLSVVEG